MKLRLKGNAVRFRLSQTDVENLAAKGFVEEMINFSKDLALSYRLELNEDILKPGISYAGNTIAVLIPQHFTNGWPGNNIAGISTLHTTEDGTEIFIIVEKDFKCLDDTEEDQSDNFANPKLMKL
ncbi:DUF7009 family protein [Ferruginibacter sp.]|uniref:DUF7009 family protein n=1 Tax=Ferruginibacter sp. TaxID=1940288 RepID=UPI002658C1F1|nr:hypothetical protein [Ferruginibacter sp.]